MSSWKNQISDPWELMIFWPLVCTFLHGAVWTLRLMR